MNKKYLNEENFHYVIVGFVGGCLLLALAWGLGFVFQHVRQNVRVKKKSSLVVPYYKPDVLIVPTEFKPTLAAIPPQAKIKLPILMYHYVEYVADPGDLIRKSLDINPYVFESELKALHDADYNTYFVKDVPEIIEGKIVPSKKSVILTFDDGYEDFYRNVFPLLKKYQMQATIYIIYDYIGRRGFLNEAEIKEIIKSGLVEVGAHTLDHYYLKKMPERIARKQIFESKKLLEDRFGIEVKTFAYPYGAFDSEAVNLVKEASYSAAVSVVSGDMQSSENLYFLSRIRPGFFTGATIVQFLQNFNK